MKLIIICLGLVTLSATVSGQIRNLNLEGSRLIDTGKLNYAISSPELNRALGWKTVSVSGDKATAWTSNCAVQRSSLREISPSALSLIEDTRAHIAQYDSGESFQGRLLVGGSTFTAAKYPLTDSIHSRSYSYEGGSNFISSTLRSASSEYELEDFTTSGPPLPSNIVRVFVNGDLITYVYRDARIIMKPIACLDPSERQLYQQIKADQKQHAESVRRLGQDVHDNLQNMQVSMRRNALNMGDSIRRSIEGSFFPFSGLYGFPLYGPRYNPYTTNRNRPSHSDNYPTDPYYNPFFGGFPFSGLPFPHNSVPFSYGFF